MKISGQQDEVRLYRSGGYWMAQHKGPQARQVYELFGTVNIPTPFSSEVNEVTVLSKIQALNPDKIVYILI